MVRWAGWAGRMLVIAGCCCLALACDKGGGAQVCYEMGAEKLISGVSGNNLSQFCANGKGLRGDFVGRNPHFWSFLA